MQGDFGKAEKELNWRPKTNLEQLVKLMVKSDMEKLRTGVSIDKESKIFVAGIKV